MGLVSCRDAAFTYLHQLNAVLATQQHDGRAIAAAAMREGFPQAVRVAAEPIYADTRVLRAMRDRAQVMNDYYANAVWALRTLDALFYDGGLNDRSTYGIRNTLGLLLAEGADPRHAEIVAGAKLGLAEAEAAYTRADWRYDEPGREGADELRRKEARKLLDLVITWLAGAEAANG